MRSTLAKRYFFILDVPSISVGRPSLKPEYREAFFTGPLGRFLAAIQRLAAVQNFAN
jgi:hypothetical protein